jgi:hypothetical protein
MLLWGIAILGVSSCLSARAETIGLKNGDELVGEIITRDQSTVIIKEYDSGRTRRVMRSAIDYISLAGVPDPNAKNKRADIKGPAKEETKVAEKKEEKKEGEGEKKEAPKEGEKKEGEKAPEAKDPHKDLEKKEAPKEGEKKEEKPAEAKPATTAETKPAETKPEEPKVTPPGDKTKRKKLLQGQVAPKEEE